MESAVFDLKIEKTESLPGDEGSSANLKPFGDSETNVEPERLSMVSFVFVSEMEGVGVRSASCSGWWSRRSRWSSSDSAGDEKSISRSSNLMNLSISSVFGAAGCWTCCEWFRSMRDTMRSLMSSSWLRLRGNDGDGAGRVAFFFDLSRISFFKFFRSDTSLMTSSLR
ncbi:hypothetical protein OGATHE_001598 [Ogataea polymorpha]|uniref:Uncharacterized protein n=1 Tax=Ogataea polymorpha TaxID=460523 RepID=A0A9P8TDA5_9ASCO|nr:hypothetical protein OGATHE_001598 [Ogataea polymorpha]